jgi:hypothetical protein
VVSIGGASGCAGGLLVVLALDGAFGFRSALDPDRAGGSGDGTAESRGVNLAGEPTGVAVATVPAADDFDPV